MNRCSDIGIVIALLPYDSVASHAYKGGLFGRSSFMVHV